MNELKIVPSVSSKRRTEALVDAIKRENVDFEFYPTDVRMLDAIKTDIEKQYDKCPSVPDCGAGDGRVLAPV